MAARKGSKAIPSAPVVPDVAVSLDRISKIMALSLAKHEEEQPKKIAILASLGYSHGEVAQLLGIKTNTVAVSLFRLRSKK